MNPCIVSNELGGAIVAWTDNRPGPDYDIYAARIDSSGSMPWTYNGVIVCEIGMNQYDPEITKDGSGGAIIAWIDERINNRDIYIQKIDQNGSSAWIIDGIAVAFSSDDQQNHKIVSDLDGGAIVVWDDHESGVEHNIRADRIRSDGVSIWWPGTGLPVSDYTSDQYAPVMVSDGSGGAIIAWLDYRNSNWDVYAQHMDYGGGANWAEDGIPVCLTNGLQTGLDIVTDGFGGAIILWTYDRYLNSDIYGQKIDSGGNPGWQENGIDLTPWPADQSDAKTIATDDSGIIVTWTDVRDLTNVKLYAQIFDRHGQWGDPAPVITGVSDVPGDQGGKVRITWSPARMDEYPEQTVTHYTIWRSVEGPAALALRDEAMLVASPCEVGLDFEGTAYRFDLVGAAAAWEWVASVEAHYWEEYAYTCETLQDSTASNDGMLHFVISANTANPFVFWDSDPDSGWSVDNLAPCTPQELIGEQSYLPAGLALSWAPNVEADLGVYKAYRGTDPTFEPTPDNLFVTTCDTLAFDGEWTSDSGYCYKIAAVDIHGNESGCALLCSDQVTGDDPSPLPDVTFLEQNWPNPFNPSTTISFGLERRTHVSLCVYNVKGELVATLVDELMTEGRKEVGWEAKDNEGRSVASGIYFYRLMTGDFVQTRKMVLLR
jgi:hypothetical protein